MGNKKGEFMRYLNFSIKEVKAFKESHRRTPKIFSVLAIASFLVVLFFIPILVFPKELLPGFLASFSLTQTIIYLSSGVLSLIVLFYRWHHVSVVKKELKRDLKEHKKKIYLGIIADKKVKDSGKKPEYYLYMDGKRFKVNEGKFHSFKVGEAAEFHVSNDGKYLFKVEKPSIFIPRERILEGSLN